MAEIVLSNCKLWVGEYDLSGQMNALALDDGPDMLDNTKFGDAGKSRKKGLSAVIANHKGFWDANSDLRLLSNTIGVVDIPMTMAMISGAEGEAAYSFLAQTAEYTLGGAVGELLGFTVRAESVGAKLIRGHILANETVIATDNGTAFELGAVGATQYLYGAIHVTDAATAVGDTLNVIIESDTEEAFGDTPETQITFTEILGNGGATYEWATPIAGAIADTWWRASWTVVSSDDPSFDIVIFMGIA